MGKFIVHGKQKLSGTFVPSGNKNEALSVLAACLLTKKPVELTNVPNIGDVNTMRKIITALGAKQEQTAANKFLINAENIAHYQPPHDLASQIRGSFLLLAPLLVRFGAVCLPLPGGDKIGRRRLDTHFLALAKLGVEVKVELDNYHLSCQQLRGTRIFLDEASVMATENAIMASVLAEGSTTIYNAACEPHVQGLCRMLNQMGAKISGIASNMLQITGVSSLNGTNYRIQDDHIEIGSIIGMAAVTKSCLTIKGAAKVDLGLAELYFAKLGVRFDESGSDLVIPAEQEMRIIRDDRLKTPKIDDAPWPGFPADLLSIMLMVATQCQGSVLIFEKLFESRLFWVDKLISMGAEVILCDPHRALVSGPAVLYGQKIVSPDIRAGMALLIAAMAAEGQSSIFNIEQIDRGYDRIDKKLNDLGAQIIRAKD